MNREEESARGYSKWTGVQWGWAEGPGLALGEPIMIRLREGAADTGQGVREVEVGSRWWRECE